MMVLTRQVICNSFRIRQGLLSVQSQNLSSHSIVLAYEPYQLPVKI